MSGGRRAASLGLSLRRVTTPDGMSMRYADTASSAADTRKPLVVFLHGWPESWFSWRYQLAAVAAAGYRGIAPDMRGYGGSLPTPDVGDVGQYGLATRTDDVLALLDHLGARRAALVAHDHGAHTAWNVVRLAPHRFTCYTALSVPLAKPTSGPPLAYLRSIFGDETDVAADPAFFYQLHHCLPSAAASYESSTAAALRSLFADKASLRGAAPAPIDSPSLYVDGVAEPIWRRTKQPATPPSWMSDDEFSFFVEEFERSGWSGGLMWYAVQDADWRDYPKLRTAEGSKVRLPCLFLAGDKDMVVKMMGGAKKIRSTLEEHCVAGMKMRIVPGAGHWIQQECPDVINTELLSFLKVHTPGGEAKL